MSIKVITTYSPEETIELAERIGRSLPGGGFIALLGDLGAGKTMFVKGVAKACGVEDYLYVNSPSFVVLKEYHGKKELYHFDVYRLEEDSFCQTIDYGKYFYSDGITVVEWASKIQEVLPLEYLEIEVEHSGETERKFSIRPVGARFVDLVKKIT